MKVCFAALLILFLFCATLIDEAVISGSLVWKKVPSGFPRTLAEFMLTLTLSSNYYGNYSIGSEVSMPGMLMFGDDSETNELIMTVSLK